MRISTNSFYKSQIALMQNQNANIAKLQLQISSNQKYQSAHEAPVATAQIRSMDSFLIQIASYAENLDLLENRYNLVETSTDTILGDLQRAMELTKQASNGTLNAGDRQAISRELEGIIENLIRIGNTQDANGEYIFSGFQTQVKPFVNINGSITYQGDQGRRMLPVNQTSSMVYSDSGHAIFENIRTGNGDFVTSQNQNNTGTGVISPGSVIDRGQYISDQYTIQFVTNAGGNTGYVITGANSGQIIPALPATVPAQAPDFTQNQNIIFNGIEISISGLPNPGDEFSIAPSQTQNIFTTLQQVVNILKQNPSSAVERATFQNSLSQFSESLKQGFNHIRDYIAEIGSRAANLDSEKNFNDSLKTQIKTMRGRLGDTDPVEAIMLLNQQMQNLQLAQQVFVKAQNLSLLNFIR